MGRRRRWTDDRDVLHVLQLEMVRGKRQGHGLTLVLLDLHSDTEAPRTPELYASVEDLVRRYDVVLPGSNGDALIVIAPHSVLPNARTLADRLSAATRLSAGAASFPEDGDSGPGLLSLAAQRLQPQQTAGQQ